MNIRVKRFFRFTLKICICTLIIMILRQIWIYELWTNDSFRRNVNILSNSVKARTRILFLKTYESIEQAKEDSKLWEEYTFIESDGFVVFPEVHLFLVKEKCGYKIEDHYEFFRGHDGITIWAAYYTFFARKVDQKWDVFIEFYDNNEHQCWSEQDKYNTYSYLYQDKKTLHQATAFSFPSSTESLIIHIDSDYYIMQKQIWTGIYGSSTETLGGE